jgi:GNAT superfamily N-acetyltransferase
VGKTDDRIVTSCILVIVPNLTHNQRPYALIENVVTDAAYRNRGFATAILGFAKQIAVNHRCYKIMLMTRSRLQSTLNFYRKAGYNAEDKTAFIQWI